MPKDIREELFSAPGLNKTGSVSRGISFGNNQSVFVNSNLNLQLEGKLTDDIGITASISDQKIPFQPEGNTQQLQEFDRVYINLYTKKSSLTAGDIVMQSDRDNYFLRYLKNGQGARVTHQNSTDSTSKSITSAGVAISKGKFHSMSITGLEGVQGPYKLQGPNGERFISVLANSEKVFVDGKPVKRGFNYDYIIDYNLGEITFMNEVLITRFTRIRVDFEFSERNYNRTNRFFNYEKQTDKWKVNVGYYSEKDNRNAPLSVSLSSEDQLYLSTIGDETSLSFKSGIDSVGFGENNVLYQPKDTVINGELTTIYVYSTDPDSSVYQLAFTDFGEGEGDYIRLSSTINGAIYQYSPPDADGNQTGRYQPLRIVPLPSKKQMYSVGATYSPSANTDYYVETALSDVDVNLFSSQDDGDNYGMAVLSGVRVKNIAWKKTKIGLGVNYEFMQADFSSIDRFRNVDFERDWSSSEEVKAHNHMTKAYFNLVKNKQNYLKYQAIYRNKKEVVNGLQQKMDFKYHKPRYFVEGAGFLMNNETDVSKASWYRTNIKTGLKINQWVPSIRYEQDKNKVQDTIENVTSTAMYFDQLTFKIERQDTLKFQVYSAFSYREDKDTNQQALQLRTITQQLQTGWKWKYKKFHQFNVSGTYRTLEDLRFGDQNEETFVGRLDWKARFFKNTILSDLVYTSATSRELKREFLFVEVPFGEGTHNWLGDLNTNEIRDIDEFVVAANSVDSSNYIKTFVPTDEFVKAYQVRINYRLRLKMPVKWKKEKGMKKLLSRFSNNTAVQLDRKITNTSLLPRLNPFYGTKTNDLLSFSKVIRSTMFFNRSHPRYGVNVAYLNSGRKYLLTEGFDSTGITEWKSNIRYNIQRKFTLSCELKSRLSSSQSNFLNDKDFDVHTGEITPELSFQPGTSWRTSLFVAYGERKNVTGPEYLTHQKIGAKARISKVSNSTVDTRIEYVNVQHNQLQTFSSSLIGYEMLQGLQEGGNWQWRVSLLKRLANGLQINIVYEARKSPSTRTVHIGRMQVSALF